MLFGCVALVSAVGGHDLLACELSQAPKAMAPLAPVATSERKPMKLVTSGERLRVERREPLHIPIPSRRIILQ